MARLLTLLLVTPLLAVVLVGGFVLGTEGGFEWALRTAERLSGGVLQLEAVSGQASGPIELAGVEIRAGGGRYRAGRLLLDWQPAALIEGRLQIMQLTLSDVELALPEPAAESAPASDRAFALPLQVVLEGARIERLRLERPDAAPLEIAAIELAATADARQLTVSRLSAELLAGQIEGRGELGWSEGLGWQAVMTVEHIDPGGLWPDWPGRLDGRLAVSGATGPEGVRYQVALQELAGELRGYPVAGEGRLEADPASYRIDALQLASGANRLEASGQVAGEWSLDWTLEVVEPDALLPGWEGELAASGRLTGPRARPRVRADISGRQIRSPGLSVGQLTGRVALAAGEGAQQASLEAVMVQAAGRSWDKVVLRLDGPWREHRLAATAQAPDSTLDLTLTGGLRNGAWQGRLADAGWRFPGVGAWRLEAPAALQASRERLHLAEACFRAANQASGRLCSGLDATPAGPWSVAIEAEAVPLALFQPPGAELSGQLDGQVQAKGRVAVVEQAEVSARVTGARLASAEDGLPTDVRVPNAEIEARLGGEGLTGRLDARLPGDDFLRGEVSLPGWQPGQADWRAQPVAASLAGQLHQLTAVKYLVEDIGRLQGEIDIDLRARGTLGRPVVAGGLRLREGALDVDAAGVQLTAVRMDLASEADGLELHGSARSGDGTIEFEGRLRLEDFVHWQADLSLAGEKFTVLDTAEAHVVVNPDLEATLRPPEVRLSGKIHVAEAWFRPRDLSGAVQPSGDVVLVDSGKEPVEEPERWQVYSDILITLSDRVRLDGFGVKGRIAGKLRLLDVPGRPTTGQGQLSIEDGSYRIYGRELDIVQGRLLFSGGPIDDPGVDFKAERKIKDIVAGVRVTGVLSDPVLNLYSDPELPDSDILAYLTFGRPLSQVGAGTGTSPGAAAAAAGGNFLAGQVGERLGLDELRVESGETLEEASLVLGTYLSPKLYVRYAAGFDRAVNRFEARYEFSRRWAIQTETSQEETGADIVFTIEK